jgi:hypothetical protein
MKVNTEQKSKSVQRGLEPPLREAVTEPDIVAAGVACIMQEIASEVVIKAAKVLK